MQKLHCAAHDVVTHVIGKQLVKQEIVQSLQPTWIQHRMIQVNQAGTGQAGVASKVTRHM